MRAHPPVFPKNVCRTSASFFSRIFFIINQLKQVTFLGLKKPAFFFGLFKGLQLDHYLDIIEIITFFGPHRDLFSDIKVILFPTSDIKTVFFRTSRGYIFGHQGDHFSDLKAIFSHTSQRSSVVH